MKYFRIIRFVERYSPYRTNRYSTIAGTIAQYLLYEVCILDVYDFTRTVRDTQTLHLIEKQWQRSTFTVEWSTNQKQ